ncbi:hypothetical protein EGR_04892 [Echinococcus granulosus]|uniref:Uncharacterized protein n=1 Tax=Echinococcus granulosus TaxID=6210 RepID=W6UPI6_ECHGR|nr:hypothetical protein EGR_04892 [Echinococcus granulosus]EUB60182.1 hypothetical protein EGR_04892 [Echinococcus granulosus]
MNTILEATNNNPSKFVSMTQIQLSHICEFRCGKSGLYKRVIGKQHELIIQMNRRLKEENAKTPCKYMARSKVRKGDRLVHLLIIQPIICEFVKKAVVYLKSLFASSNTSAFVHPPVNWVKLIFNGFGCNPPKIIYHNLTSSHAYELQLIISAQKIFIFIRTTCIIFIFVVVSTEHAGMVTLHSSLMPSMHNSHCRYDFICADGFSQSHRFALRRFNEMRINHQDTELEISSSSEEFRQFNALIATDVRFGFKTSTKYSWFFYIDLKSQFEEGAFRITVEIDLEIRSFRGHMMGHTPDDAPY